MNKPLDKLETQLPKNVFLVIDKQLFPVNKTTIKIGRHAENDLIISDLLVSRWHAEIRFEEETFIIYDMESKYGTAVNNEPTSRRILKSGDTISLANTPLLFIDRSEQVIRRSQDTTGILGKNDL
jgi:pSer/pThr/pTyr-binding forkhead associated (FHA) protein